MRKRVEFSRIVDQMIVRRDKCNGRSKPNKLAIIKRQSPFLKSVNYLTLLLYPVLLERIVTIAVDSGRQPSAKGVREDCADVRLAILDLVGKDFPNDCVAFDAAKRRLIEGFDDAIRNVASVSRARTVVQR